MLVISCSRFVSSSFSLCSRQIDRSAKPLLGAVPELHRTGTCASAFAASDRGTRHQDAHPSGPGCHWPLSVPIVPRYTSYPKPCLFSCFSCKHGHCKFLLLGMRLRQYKTHGAALFQLRVLRNLAAISIGSMFCMHAFACSFSLATPRHGRAPLCMLCRTFVVCSRPILY